MVIAFMLKRSTHHLQEEKNRRKREEDHSLDETKNI